MKKKYSKIISILIALLLSGHVNAQINLVSLEAKGGMNVSNISANAHKSRVGYNVGLGLDFNFPIGLTIATGAEMHSKGARKKGGGYQMEATYLQVPAYLGYKFEFDDDFHIHVNLGPYFAYGFGGKTKRIINGERSKEDTFGDGIGQLDKFDWGIGLDTGFNVDRLRFHIGYTHGMKDTANADAPSLKNRAVHISVGFIIF